jgi:hypothetical protein
VGTKLNNTGKMKKIILRIFLILLPLGSWAGPGFDKYFTSGVLRFDYLLAGKSDTTYVFPAEIKREKIWGGSRNFLVDTLNMGTYQYRVFDQKSGKLIFLKGFCPLFQEWQTTPEAKKISKSFYQVLRFPFPKSPVRIEIDQRKRDGNFESLYSALIDPSDYFILDENPVPVIRKDILLSGDPAHKIDIAFLAEGYTAGQMEKFLKDCKTLSDSLFRTAPFSTMKNYFNIYALETPSEESGTDVPGEKIYRNTVFNTSFYTFDISRYLTTSDMKTIHDKAAGIPYDQLIILVNTNRYGGGGFYNFLHVCTSDNSLSPKVFIHEFGHSFAGLGDEYYTSEVAFEDYYNLKAEPWEPNLTTLVNFDSKWKKMVDSSTPIPTPRIYEYISKTGAFEGGGYTAKGIYSPMQDCRMKSNETSRFCPVCQRAIMEVIRANTK